MINWKLEITENETRLVIQNGTVMSRDVLGLARHLVNKYDLIKLPIYHEDGSKYFEYSFNEDVKCSSFPLSFFLMDKLERNVSKSKRTEDRVLWLLVNQQIFFTKDKTFIADCIQKFFMEDVRYYHPDNMDLIEWYDKIRKDISALDEKKYPYFIFNATSVTDSVYNMFFRFNDDTLEDIPISLKEKDKDIVDFVYIENGKIKKLISNLEI